MEWNAKSPAWRGSLLSGGMAETASVMPARHLRLDGGLGGGLFALGVALGAEGGDVHTQGRVAQYLDAAALLAECGQIGGDAFAGDVEAHVLAGGAGTLDLRGRGDTCLGGL